MVSFFEIYGGRSYDLLNKRKKLVIREDGDNRVTPLIIPLNNPSQDKSSRTSPKRSLQPKRNIKTNGIWPLSSNHPLNHFQRYLLTFPCNLFNLAS